MSPVRKVLIFFVFFFATGCITPRIISFSPSSLEERQLQTRIYQTNDEISLLSAGVATLQDMGYSLDESETSAGVVVASKTVTAANAGQIATYFALSLLGGVELSPDRKQKIRVSFITFPSRRKKNKHSRLVSYSSELFGMMRTKFHA